MSLLKLLLICLVTVFVNKTVEAQIPQLPTNANINIVTANAGVVIQGSIIDLSVSVTNTGANPIQANRVRPSISIPIAIAAAAANGFQTGLPAGWIIVANTGNVITICNGTDVIPAGVTRTAIIKIIGNNLGGPSTIGSTLQFGPGTAVCSGFATLNGDAPADNISQTSITVIAACPLTVSATAGTIACNAGTTTITATTAGAVGGVEYSITGIAGPFQTSNIFTVPAGTYTVLARQLNNVNCTALSSTLTITQPPAITTPTLGTITQPSCTVATGSVVLSGLPIGSWTINPGNISGSGSSTSIANLTNGTYNFIVTNATGCSSNPSSSAVINVQPPTPTVPIVGTITQPTCTAPVGSVILSGLPAGNWTINPGNIAGSGTTTTIANLLPGTFNFTVTNADGCASTATANVVINNTIGIPAAPVVTIVQPTCTNPIATITVSSPTAGLTFSFDNGAYINYPVSGFSAGDGTHTLSIQTAAGCISANTNIVINPQTPTPAAPTVNIVQPSCTSATAIVTVTSPTVGLTFSLDGGAFTAFQVGGYTLPQGSYTLSTQNASGCISAITTITINQQPETPAVPVVGLVTQPTCVISSGSVMLSGLPIGNWTINPGNISGTGSSFTLTGLANGNYNFTVLNAVGCVSTGAANVTINAVLGAPTEPTVNVIQPTCTNANGTITITSTTMGLLFSLDGGSYLPYPVGGYIVPAGLHTILAQNAAFCLSAVTNVSINNQPATPAAPTVLITQPSCTMATAIVVITSNTTGLFSLNGGAFLAYPVAGYMLASSNHTLVAQNAEGCVSTITNIGVNAQPPTPPTPTVSIVQPTCSVSTALTTITSLTTGLTCSVDGAAYASYPTTGYMLASGTHTLSAQNSFGCISTILTFSIDVQPSTPAVPTISIVQPDCTVATGLVTVTSPTTDLNFSLNGANAAPYPVEGYSLAAGIYTLTAQNSFGCISAQANITINTQSGLPTGIITAGNISCNGGTTQITVNASGGTTPYEYSLNGVAFQTANTFTVGTGTYTVTVRSANSCTAVTNTITIAQPAAITATVVGGTIACNGGNTNLTVSAAGGIPPLQYSLNNSPNFQTSNIFTVTAGMQTITVKDANGCRTTANVVTLIQPLLLEATATSARILYCGGKTDVTVAATGGTAPYTGIGTFIRGAGIFTFTVTDARGCIATTQIDIEAPGCGTLQGYPNPTKNFITINHTIAEEGATMQMYSVHGQRLAQKAVPVGAFTTTIDLRNFASGSYVAVYQNGNDRKSILFEKVN